MRDELISIGLPGLMFLGVTIWLVCRAVEWLPKHYAHEDALWLAHMRAKSIQCDGLPVQIEELSGQEPAAPPFVGLPRPGAMTLIAVVSVVTVAIWACLNQMSPESIVAWFVFGCGLVILALVDYQTRLLPDILTLPLIWLGLLIQLWPATRTVGLEMAVIGAVAGYLPLWLLAHFYWLVRKRDGLGMGDLKLLAAMGAWSGPWVLPYVLLGASLLAILGVICCRLLASRRIGMQEELPFGPSIILAYGLVLLASA